MKSTAHAPVGSIALLCIITFWGSSLVGSGQFAALFYAVQGIELVAGAVNITLMSLNMRDGLRLSGRLSPPRRA